MSEPIFGDEEDIFGDNPKIDFDLTLPVFRTEEWRQRIISKSKRERLHVDFETLARESDD